MVRDPVESAWSYPDLVVEPMQKVAEGWPRPVEHSGQVRSWQWELRGEKGSKAEILLRRSQTGGLEMMIQARCMDATPYEPQAFFRQGPLFDEHSVFQSVQSGGLSVSRIKLLSASLPQDDLALSLVPTGNFLWVNAEGTEVGFVERLAESVATVTLPLTEVAEFRLRRADTSASRWEVSCILPYGEQPVADISNETVLRAVALFLVGKSGKPVVFMDAPTAEILDAIRDR